MKIQIIFFLGLLLFISCSSAPKRPAEIFTNRNTAETRLDDLNKEADRGNYEKAMEMLREVRRLVVSTDDPRLLIQEGLARGNILYSLDQRIEARLVWENALKEAEVSGEKELASAVKIYLARSRLFEDPNSANEVKTTVNREISSMRKERQFIALGWTVIGLAEKELGRWTDGENAIKRALAIHEKDNYLEQAAYSWYLIALIRNTAGNHNQALEALQMAIAFDRRAENTYGLGMNWRAVGDIHRRIGNQNESIAAYNRALEIFRSADLGAEADVVEARLAR